MRAGKGTTINMAVLVASVILGFLLTVQFRSTAALLPVREQSRLATTDAVHRLEEEQHALKAQISDLRARIADIQRLPDSRAAFLPLQADLDQQRLLVGLVSVHGPGIIVTLDDSPRAISPKDDANNYIIHDYELRDVVSLLWLAGAEAIAINGERLVNVSSLYCVGSTILVNNTRLSPPYEIRAIGPITDLERAVQDPRNLSKLRARVKTYGIQFKVAPQSDMVIPAFGGDLHIRYARPVRPSDRDEGQKTKGM